ncbi:MAG: PKD domain-containing protein [Candidatus Hydrogenedentes bacterium]|nr:PKD domain-containing protein [Candidatus Hydrogenedentota bacterium]
MFGRSGSYLLPALMVLGAALLVGCPGEPRDLGAQPEARFDAAPRSGYVPLVVEFFDSSDPGESDIAQWYWDFGDYTSSTERDPRHTYYVADNYTVSLRVTTAVGTSTKTIPNCVSVTDPIAVVPMDSTGGTIEAFGGTLTAPPGAFTSRVIVGMTAGEAQMPVDFAEQEQVVSLVYTIQHDQPDLRVERNGAGSNTLELDLPFYAPMVPESDRTAEKLYVFARYGNGVRTPIPGRVMGERLIADLAGLPHTANYAVVYRPTALAETVTAELPLKTPTSYQWNTGKWRLAYSTGMLQTLTALRVGNPHFLQPYDWRDFSTLDMDQTLAELRDQVAEVHQTADEAGLISPMLNVTPDGEYNLLFYPMKPPAGDFTCVGETLYATSLFGSIVIDPEQLVAISKRQADASDDGIQEMAFLHAFTEELFRAAFCGYDYPSYTVAVAPQYGTDRRPVNVPFTLGFNEGLAVYAGQIAAREIAYRPAGTGYTTVFKPRGFSPNEYALLSEPLFAPASPRTPGYATATQDFFFYLANKYAPAGDPLTFVADSYDGVLEMLRINAGAPDAVDYETAMRQARMAVDVTLLRLFHKGLPEIYWTYARDRAFENPSDSKIRPSDYARKAYTFNDDRFEPQAVARSTISGLYEQDFTRVSYPRLGDVPPLTTVALVLTAAQGFSCDLKVAVNAYDWDVDTYGNTMRAIAYLSGADGIEMTSAESEAVLTGFGATTTAGKAVVLLSNTSMENAYSVEVTVTSRQR